MKKIKDKLQARAKFNKGKRVGYAKGRPVVDRETGEIIPVLTPGMTSGRKVQQSKFEPVTVQTTAPVKATATTPTTLSVGTSSPAPVLPEEKIETNYSPNQKTSKNFRETLAVKDTKDYASMSDDEIKKLIPQISYGTPGNEKTVPIGQERIDEFRLEKTNPGLLFEMVQKGADISPNDYNDPTAKKVAERLLNQRLAMEKAAQDAASNKPTPKPAPDGTPENPFQMQPTPTPTPAPSPFDDPTYKSPFSGTTGAALTQAQKDRELRLEAAGQKVEDIASGKVGLPPTAKAEAILIDEPSPETTLKADESMFVQKPAPVEADVISEERAREVAEAAPATVVSAPEKITASTIAAEDIVKVPEEAIVKAAKGEVSPEVSQILADAAGIAEVQPIEAAKVEVIPGALTERVVGVISPEAKAQAATVAGTTLAKVTRAKKQLKNAGLSDEAIAELGNDPEALEDRLMDLTEAERGIIEGLPEEALVSTQLNNLLNGIEEGVIPPWAAPAVASVEQMLAQRGMSASSVGRDALVNTIIGASIPLAQANAQAIQASVSQQKNIEAQAELTNAQFRQQTAMDNANKVFQMDMAQFTSDQQIALSNSKFLQTVSLTNTNNEQQAVLQEASLMAQRNLAEADQNTKLGITNAQAFLQMDMTNLSNEQQSYVLKAQMEQQRMLSNQGAVNAALQFNATSENQTNQFMAQLATNVELNNAQRADAMNQFNVTQKNQAFAQEYQSQAEAEKFNAQLAAQTDQFNAQQEFARQQFNAQNSLVIEQSNVQWRRDITKADTAIQNQINMQNAQNNFAMSQAAQAQLWQELRDEFDYIFKASENAQNRKTNIAVAGLQGGEGSAHKNAGWMANLAKLIQMG